MSSTDTWLQKKKKKKRNQVNNTENNQMVTWFLEFLMTIPCEVVLD